MRVPSGQAHAPSVAGPLRDLFRAIGASITEFRAYARGDVAAGLTYYAVLAAAPLAVAIVAGVGLFGRDPQTTDMILKLIGDVGPPSAAETFRGTVEGIVSDKGSAGTLTGLGVVGAIWSTTGWLDAFFRVANASHRIDETRGLVRRKSIQAAMTVGMAAGLVTLAALVVVSGPIAQRTAEALGAEGAALRAWSIAQWPTAAGLAVLLVTGLFKLAPDRRSRGWRTALSGAVVAVVAWSIASAGFGLYVAQFGSYNVTYGALGAIVVFLVWLWITNVALVVGVGVDAALERRRQRAIEGAG